MNPEKLLREYRLHISEKLMEIFDNVILEDEQWFILPDNQAIHIVELLSGYNSLVIEYAENSSERSRNLADDGDQFSILDYDTPEKMFEAMMQEIENEGSSWSSGKSWCIDPEFWLCIVSPWCQWPVKTERSLYGFILLIRP